MRAFILAFALALAACGADGNPEPVPGERRSGVSVSGTATIGVGGRL